MFAAEHPVCLGDLWVNKVSVNFWRQMDLKYKN